MFPYSSVEAVTQLTKKDIKFVVGTVIGGPTTAALTPHEFLVCLVYDLLKSSGFEVEAIAALLRFHGKNFQAVSDCIQKNGDKIPAFSLAIMDNRFTAMMGFSKDIYDFIEMVPVERIPVPAVTLSIVLPEVYRRAFSVLRAPSDRPTVKVNRPPREEVQPDVAEHTRLVEPVFDSGPQSKPSSPPRQP